MVATGVSLIAADNRRRTFADARHGPCRREARGGSLAWVENSAAPFGPNARMPARYMRTDNGADVGPSRLRAVARSGASRSAQRLENKPLLVCHDAGIGTKPAWASYIGGSM